MNASHRASLSRPLLRASGPTDHTELVMPPPVETPAVETASPDELSRVERFVAAYNAIDDVLQSFTGTPQTFRAAVDFYAGRHPWWRDAETLRLFATLRNFLVHEKTRPFDYPCIPSEGAVREIEAIRDRMVHPRTVGEMFSRKVLVLSPDDELNAALDLIAAHNVSRFPIYNGKRFVGLLTENGIARYLASRIAQGQEFLPQVPVRDVLPRETKRPNFRFAEAATPVTQVAFWFHEATFLEAVLVVDSGQEHAHLRGIVTRGDVAGWSE